MDNTVVENIQKVKDRIGEQAESIIASGLGLEQKGKMYRCPNHYSHNNGDRVPSMSYDPNLNQFWCFACNHRIDIYSYYREHLNYTYTEIIKDILNEDVKEHANSKIYKSVTNFNSELSNISQLTGDLMSYINKRGVTVDTANKFKLQAYKGGIAFPYFRYEKVVGYKVRHAKKVTEGPKMWSVPGSKPYLFGVQHIDLEEEEIVVCEGEFDCMIISQAGIRNVVSVGAGANSLSTVFEQAEEFFQSFRRIIVVSDADEAGSKMDKAFIERYGDKVKLIDKKLYGQKEDGSYNDINDEHYKSGNEKILEIIDSARFKIQGRRDLDLQPYKGLENLAGLKYIPTGFETIDELINDLEPGALTIITGMSNAGKTLFARQIVVNAIDKQAKTYYINGEDNPEILLNKIFTTLISNPMDFAKMFEQKKINRKTIYEPKKATLEVLRYWHNKKLYMFNKGEAGRMSTEKLLEMLEDEIKFNNHNLIIVDNLMSVLQTTTNDKLNDEKMFVDRLKDLATIYNTHIILVVHPNKTYVPGEQAHFTQISGTSDIYNLADNIIWVYREYDEEKRQQGFHGAIEVQKGRTWGELGKVSTHFNNSSKRLQEISEAGTVDIKKYPRWEQLVKESGLNR